MRLHVGIPFGFAIAAAIFAGPAIGADLTIGIAAPISGTSALLGEQVSDGAAVAASAASQAIILKIVDDGCTAEGGAKAAAEFVAAKVTAVVGFLCAESIEAALPVLKQADIPVITVGVRTNGLTDRRQKTGWPVWRLGPRADAEQAAVGAILTREWREKLFAIIDDGTIYGRELAETLRGAAEQAALKPVFVDTFRPQLDNQIGLAGRLGKAGATHVFAGGDREDIAILARDATGLGLVLTIAGGESLRAVTEQIPLSPGVEMIAVPEWGDKASPDLLARFKTAEASPDGYALPAFVAVQILAEAAANAVGGGKSIAETLASATFQTAIGVVDFDDKGDLATNPYRLFRYDGTKFVEVQ